MEVRVGYVISRSGGGSVYYTLSGSGSIYGSSFSNKCCNFSMIIFFYGLF